MTKKKLVVLTGAGISAESGIPTFRDVKDGLWMKYDVNKVSTHEGYLNDPALIHEFYSNLRKQMADYEPSEAHRILAELEKDYDVQIITQNADDLHERAGSSKIHHFHGEIYKVHSTTHPERVYDLREDPFNNGGSLVTTTRTTDPYGDPVRPHLVFFNEMPLGIEWVYGQIREADIVIVIGTSLQVMPFAGLPLLTKPTTPCYYIDRDAKIPSQIQKLRRTPVVCISATATEGLKEWKEKYQ